MLLLHLTLASSLVSPLLAFPSFAQLGGNYQRGLRRDLASNGTIYLPPRSTDTGLKVIPDAAHPWEAPGPNDQRGPCPGLNTLANHGYLPRNGIATIADIIEATGEGFNMEYDLAAGIAAFGVLTRGNVLLGQVSIGGPSPLVPPLPGNIDGTPGGLATHGRFEGDVSMTRQDAALGDNRYFQPDLYAQFLTFVNQFGTNTTNSTIVTANVLGQFKAARFADSLARNPEFQFHVTREEFSFGEAAFVLSFFPNGTTGNLTVPVMTSFFANESFPQDWYRRSTPNDISNVGNVVGDVIVGGGNNVPPPGEKNSSDVYVPDVLGNDTSCLLYDDLINRNVPAVLVSKNATEGVRQNTQVLLNLVANVVGSGCPPAAPGLIE